MSVAWTFFIKCPDDVSKAQCSVCHKKVCRGGTNSRDFTTSNLIKHLKNNHNNEFMKVTNKRKRNLKVNNAVSEAESEVPMTLFDLNLNFMYLSNVIKN